MSRLAAIGGEAEQRRLALAQANRVRIGLARLKDTVHADPSWQALADVVAGDVDPRLAARIQLADLLTAGPSIGRSKARRICLDAGLRVYVAGWERLRLGDLSDDRRERLAGAILKHRQTLDDDVVCARSQRPRPGQKRLRPLGREERAA